MYEKLVIATRTYHLFRLAACITASNHFSRRCKVGIGRSCGESEVDEGITDGVDQLQIFIKFQYSVKRISKRQMLQYGHSLVHSTSFFSYFRRHLSPEI